MRNVEYTPDARLGMWLAVATLYSLLLMPVWGAALVVLPALTAFLIAIRQGMLKALWPFLKPVMAVFVVMVALNALAAEMPKRAITSGVQILRGLSMLLPAVLLLQITDRVQRQWVLVGLMLLMTGVAIGLLITVMPAQDRYRVLEVLAAQHMGNLHNLASATAAGLMVGFVVLLTGPSTLFRALAALAIAVHFWLLCWLQAEGSWLALIAATGAVIALFSRGLLRGLALSGIAGLVVVLHIFYLLPELPDQLMGLRFATLVERSMIYTTLLEHWQQSPWFGWGMGSYKHLAASQVSGKAFLYPHHIYLEGLYSLGVVGMLLLVVMFGLLMRRLDWQQIRTEPVSLLAFLIFSYTAVKGMSDMKLLSAQTFSLFIFSLGLMSRIPLSLPGTAVQREAVLAGSK